MGQLYYLPLLLSLLCAPSMGELTAEFVSCPDSVNIGEEFSVVFEVSSGGRTTFDAYSYVYNGSSCKSLWGWIGNKREYTILANQTMRITLNDSLSRQTAPGTYKLKVRLRSDVDTDLVREITAIAKKPDIYKKLDMIPKDHVGYNLLLMSVFVFLLLLVAHIVQNTKNTAKK